MSYIRALYEPLLENARRSGTWASMADTTEGTHWHREASVAVHTEMVLEWYAEHIAPDRTPRQALLTAIACIYHDFGKPSSQRVVDKGFGPQNAYHGHELVSANSFVHEWRRLDGFVDALGYPMSPRDVMAVKLMVEHHLPFSYGPDMARKLKTALVSMLDGDAVCFEDLVLADAQGRISDDHPGKIAAVTEWMDGWRRIAPTLPNTADGPTMVLVAAPPGWGVSEFAEAERSRRGELHVLGGAVLPGAISLVPGQGFVGLLGDCDVVVDAPLHTRKSRKVYVAEARKRGYRVRCVVPLLAMGDVPDNAYDAQQLPMLGSEADELVPAPE